MFTYKEHTHGLFFPKWSSNRGQFYCTCSQVLLLSQTDPHPKDALLCFLSEIHSQVFFTCMTSWCCSLSARILYLRHSPPACVWSVFWRQFLGLGFCILQDDFDCIFHLGGMKPGMQKGLSSNRPASTGPVKSHVYPKSERIAHLHRRWIWTTHLPNMPKNLISGILSLSFLSYPFPFHLTHLPSSLLTSFLPQQPLSAHPTSCK